MTKLSEATSKKHVQPNPQRFLLLWCADVCRFCFFPQAPGDLLYLLVTSGADLDKDRAAPFQRLRQVARGQGRLGRRVVRSSVTSAPVNFTSFTPQNIPNVMDVMD
jgi:hypothetical protein